MSLTLLDALKALDPANDQHWTTDGLPRLDVLKDFMGVTVSRDEVNQNFKGFSRSNTAALIPNDAPVVTQQPVAVSTNPDQSLQDDKDEEGMEETEQVEQSSFEASETEAEQMLVSARLELIEATKAADQAIAARNLAQKRVDQIINFLEKRDGRTEGQQLADTVATFQEAQFKQRMRAAGVEV